MNFVAFAILPTSKDTPHVLQFCNTGENGNSIQHGRTFAVEFMVLSIVSLSKLCNALS